MVVEVQPTMVVVTRARIQDLFDGGLCDAAIVPIHDRMPHSCTVYVVPLTTFNVDSTRTALSRANAQRGKAKAGEHLGIRAQALEGRSQHDVI